MRMNSKGEFDKKGKFKPITWERAFDEMESQFKRHYKEKGPHGIGIFGSGQYTVMEGVAAVKFMKAGVRSNNIDPNARHCMASAVAGFIQTFGIDEPAGNYDDIHQADTIALWGANMSENHPILWSRVTDRKLSHRDKVKIVNLSTYRNRCSNFADLEIIFKPGTDLAIMNYMAREIVYNRPKQIDWDFVNKYCVFATGPVDIGYGLRDDIKHPKAVKEEVDTLIKQKSKKVSKAEATAWAHLGLKAGETLEMKNAKSAGKHWMISFEDFKKGLEPYTLDFVAELAKGDSDESLEDFKKKLVKLVDYYADSKRKVTSFWTMGFNQHTRGTWVNEQIYMLHLLLGKQAMPGNGAFSLTGQPSACGTAREVGTFAHRLPADMVVFNPKHRAKSEKLWKIPEGTLNPKVGSHYTKIMRDLEDGKIGWVWVQVNNPWHNTANANHWIKAAREMDNFIVVSDCYPTISAKVADLILPTAMIFEKWGAYGNAERRTQHWRQQVTPIGNSTSDLWQTAEFSKRFKLKEVWKSQKITNDLTLPDVLDKAKAMGYSEDDTLYDVLFDNEEARSFKWPDPVGKGFLNSEAAGDKRDVEGFKGYGFFNEGNITPSNVLWMNNNGFKCHLVSSGKEALHEIQKSEYDVIFMDLGLPDIDSVRATQDTVTEEKTMTVPDTGIKMFATLKVKELSKNMRRLPQTELNYLKNIFKQYSWFPVIENLNTGYVKFKALKSGRYGDTFHFSKGSNPWDDLISVQVGSSISSGLLLPSHEKQRWSSWNSFNKPAKTIRPYLTGFYEELLNKIIESGHHLVEITMKTKPATTVRISLKHQIDKRGLQEQIEVSRVRDFVYLEKLS
ncbi:hypothetical protein LCGC14_1460540 [marine sediment metagenome]|uniref:Molybdopterin oxidoreductase domain-containing protein n=1 Tax=marine sediment metagenome TaxID=412755 RepID=A0A0F9JFT6_9ZZZZ